MGGGVAISPKKPYTAKFKKRWKNRVIEAVVGGRENRAIAFNYPGPIFDVKKNISQVIAHQNKKNHA